MQQINLILQISTATLLAFTSLLLLRHVKRAMHLWAGIGFTLSVFCYLLIDLPEVQASFLRSIVLTGSICVPLFFWLLSASIFDDHFRFKPSLILWFLLQTVPHAHHYLLCAVDFPKLAISILNVITQATSLGFVFAAIYVAQKTKREDLIETRLRFRNSFILLTALLIGVTLIVEATPLNPQLQETLQVFQRFIILGLSTYFLLNNADFQAGFFFREIPKPKTTASADPVLEEQLMILLKQEKIYRKEGLTIKELADIMNVQEHRLRRLINGQLNFKNFNDFLNQYRVQEACAIFRDAAQNQKTVLEIAYSLGYQSIGPFNKAFKEQTNTTPTAYRKGQQA